MLKKKIKLRKQKPKILFCSMFPTQFFYFNTFLAANYELQLSLLYVLNIGHSDFK